MLFFRGAIVAAEDRNHDERSGLSPMELEYLKHRVFRGHDQNPDSYLSAAERLPQEVHDTVTVSPVVNHGRWIIRCPWCFSASMANRTDPRFYCVECGNIGAQGKWVKVIWPDTVAEIEAVLSMRPDPRTRHWWPHETLMDLLAENEQHEVM
jgi:hypothetical protein